MKISELLDFCDLVLAQYGNLDVLIFAELDENKEMTFNEATLDLLEVPVSRLSGKKRLVLGVGFGRDINLNEDLQIKKSKPHLRLIT